MSENTEMVRVLEPWGFDVNMADINGWSPLHIAVQMNLECAVMDLIDSRRADVDFKDKQGRAPVHWAAMLVSYRLRLLRIGLDVTDFFVLLGTCRSFGHIGRC